MAPTFPNTFDQGSPMTPQSASSISYQTNVNRQKTKKWTQAPAVNYGGDDWGDDDEYDAPPPPSKPTGFRQQGQGMQSSAKPESPAFDNSKKYGELPPLPSASDPRGRSNSFDADDEKRNFSSSTMRQPSPVTTTPTSGAAATRFSQITGVPSSRNPSGPPALQIQTQQPPVNTGLQKASQMVSPISGSPHPDVLQPGRVNTGESSVISPASVAPSSASDFQARRDFSPSAVPPPLTTRASPAPQSATDSPSTRFPARKSSLSQVAGPPLSEITRPSPAESAPRPWVSGPRSASPGAAARSPNTPTGKALPFIRPADIYKRAEEERRQSIESGSRPSIDSATGGVRSSDRSDSPVVSHLNEKSSSDSLGGGRRRTSFEGDDGSESGRRLMPMLEPVRERKSEYGFEGVNVNKQAPQPDTTTHTHPQQPGESAIAHEVDEEEARRLSISPKLPDLNRMSGFGMDLFSQPKEEAPELPTMKHSESSATASTSTLSPVAEDLKLHTQPSFGFRSVVNQAFDRSDDTSVPPTPASNTGSGPRRTDSESTGTTGISPIMSRVPSGAAAASRNHDVSNSSILEVVNEPDSPEATTEREAEDTNRGREVPGFKPGYRRDISTPRSDNSPARTPDLTKTKIIASGQHAIVSEASPEISSPEIEPLQPPRPIAEREASFRPSLPGGWTSYATTAQSENLTQPPSLRAQTPVRDVSPASSAGRGSNLDITPTTTKHALPQSTFGGAVAGTALAGTAGASLDQHGQGSGVTISRSPSRKPVSGSTGPPTPDPAMAPGGNLYSTANLDPRLLPKLEQAPPETQLRADAVHRDVSAQSSAAPSPPPKDSSESDDGNEDYETKPPVPLKPRTPVQAEASEALLPPSRPQMLPALSTDTHPNDEENDKLRKEIVKSLSPRPSDVTALNDNILSDEYDESNYPKQGHESTYLPREYDNYWASTSDGEEGTDSVPPPALEHIARTEATEPKPANNQDREEIDSPVIAPLSPRRPEQVEQPSLEASRPPIQSRFSWEASGANVNVAVPNDQVSEVSAVSTPVHAPQTTEEAVVPTAALSATQSSAQEQAEPIEPQVQTESTPKSHDSAEFRNKYLLAAGGVAAAAAVTTYTPTSQESSGRRLSLAEEKDPRVSSHPVSPTPPEDEHPSRQTPPYFTPSPNQNSPVPAPSTVSPVASPVLQHPSTFHTIPPLGFKEIVGIGSTQQRIHTFDLTRERFATMDSGLNEWMAHLQALHPEHASTGPSFGGSRISVPNQGASRSKFGKLTGGGGAAAAAPPLQQPYYQQYLNASSPTTPSTPVPRPGSGPSSNMASGSQQGFSSNSGKITTQQVQAKGKELLHSAGIFGGKAGKAGKGLLAKGKSKFRGGDKTSPEPKPKNERPKEDRRTSWGLPLNLTRSSGKPDQSARQSTEFSPQFQRPRAATNTSNRSFPAPQLPDISTGNSLGIMSGALASTHTNGTSGQEHQRPATIRQVQEPVPTLEESEARDSLGPPAPIGKYQPSWDPYNATPIAEEEVFQYEDRPTERQERQLSSAVANPHGSLAVPPGKVSGNERSNNDDSHFHSAQEEPSDIPNDWVMVPPNPETKDVPPTQQPVQNLTPEPNVEPDTRRSSEAPVTSILNRPRGSSYEIPSPPNSAKGPTPRPAEPPVVAAAPVPQFISSPPKPVQAEPEKQTGASSFLPPIRRTSTFGLGFGSRHAKPRFPIEDDDEGNTLPENAVKPMDMAPNLPKSAEEVRAPPQQPSTSLPHGEEIRTVDNVSPPPGPPPGWKPPASQQVPPPSTTQPSQGARPLSFVQSGEVLQTPRRANTMQQALPNEPVQRDPPMYQEPLQVREQPLREQQPREERPKEQKPVANLQQVTSPQDSSPRPPLVQAGSSNYSQQSVPGQRQMFPPQAPQQQVVVPRTPEATHRAEQTQRAMPPPQHSQLPPIVTPRASDVLQRPEFRESQVEWRPNRPKATEQPPPVVSPTAWKEMDMPPPRQSNSWEPQRPRGYSGSSQGHPQRPDGQYNERAGWVGPPTQQNPYPQPPSSAQRYPELFRPGQQGSPGPQGPPEADGPRENIDLPDHYYQAPIAGAIAFMPRHQTNEYQIPGVGPPADDPRFAGSSKRNSGFFKEIGGKISRASSRDRRNSESRDRDGGAPSPGRPFESRGNEYAESSVASEGELEQRKRRSSFFGHLSHNSTSGLGPPQSRESVIAHNSASRTDLLDSPQPSPTHQQRKRSFFGGGSKDPKEKPSKLVRASTGSHTGSIDPPGKKHNRFSGLSSMFSKTSPSTGGSVQGRPQATRELPYNERQPIESPLFGVQRPAMNTPPPSQGRAPSQTRHVLQKLTSSSSPRTSPRPDNKTRRSSGGLLGGLIGGKTKKQDRSSDDSRSQGSSQTLRGPRTLPAAQTYTDLQEQQPMAPPPQQREIPFQDPSLRVADRGRQASRSLEPQYDSVPIPGGYSLVRGQGAQAVPTQYDPRGLSQMQQGDPRYAQRAPNGQYFPNGAPLQGQPQQNDGRYGPGPRPQQPPQLQDPRQMQQPKPNLSAIETYEAFAARTAPRRLSREDLLARSPPKSLEGQQRPYQLSLPGGDDEDERPVPVEKDRLSPPKPQHDAIQRLQQPVLRHPESPAGYPLPEDTVFSPVDPRANDIPPPPPPQWPGPGRMGSQGSNTSLQHDRQLSLSTMNGDLDRSNTRRTAISAVSGLSGSRPQSGGGLNVPDRQISDATERDVGRRVSPSPSPPSPMPGTPERNVSPDIVHQSVGQGPPQIQGPVRDDIRTTEVMNRGSREDLYDASPRLPKPGSRLPLELKMSSAPSSAISNGHANANISPTASRGPLQSLRNQNPNVGRSASAGVKHTEPVMGMGGEGNVVRAASSSQAGLGGIGGHQEEKIPYRDGTVGRAELPSTNEDDGEPEMVATSYPGMEWNPYAAGAWDDGFD
ncbi:uncharacterized protein PAC_15567 [Phialocephala subalpina]|uniref:Uncharacterized protein n=1 Tax=Phialocephala subalpina TaxID=576137 RepID=A0A1L7XL55_9HELO|nr:uncharacterized protein PAC_15567 [Phialocephala subalpina]